MQWIEKMVPDSSQSAEKQPVFRPESLSGAELWLSQRQIATLMGVKTSIVADLIRHIYKTATLDKASTVRKQQVVQTEGHREVIRELNCYSREVILAVCWRVHSPQGEQFRAWANNVLDQELVQTAPFESSVANSSGELPGLLNICQRGLRRLVEFERNAIMLRNTSMLAARPLEYMEVLSVVDFLRAELFPVGEAEAFGEEKPGQLEPLLEAVLARDGLRDRYASLEEKAGQLLWMITRQQPFRDGNLRIGAFLFLWFLHRNGLLRRDDGSLRLPENALVPIVLLVARSGEEDRDAVIKLVVRMINREN